MISLNKRRYNCSPDGLRLADELAAEPLTEADLAALAERPKTRADCVGGERPCPWAACRYHLLLDVTSEGTIRVYAEDIEEMHETCALDVADREEEGATLEQVGDLLAITRERVRQIETRALLKLNRLGMIRKRVTGDDDDLF